MKVATVADLRNHFARVSQWIEEGEKVQIRKRGKVFATLTPAPDRKNKKAKWPDLQTRLEKLFPNPLPGKSASEIVSEGRGEW
jgi:antitoxin (DNA-binding transcriptional repressor) of toxin-antitoxin stability system